MYGLVCAHECKHPWRPEEGTVSPGATGGCEPPRVGAGS